MIHFVKNTLLKYIDKAIFLFAMLLILKMVFFYYATNIHLHRVNFIISFGILLIVLSVAGFFKGKLKIAYLYIVNFLFTINIFANVLYFSYYGAPITSYTFLQFQNLNGLGESVISTIKPGNLVFFVDLILLPIYYRYSQHAQNFRLQISKKACLVYLIVGLIATLYYPLRIYSYNENALKPKYDASDLLREYGLFAHQILDGYAFINEKGEKELSKEERNQISNWFGEKSKQNVAPAYSTSNNGSFEGIGKGKNLIVIQVESLQNFVINKEINGQEITPNLNGMLGNSVYFPNFYPQTIEGNSSDAEFLTQTSLYPISKGAVFFRFPNNQYFSLAKLMKNEGYSSVAIHADEATFWNLNEMYPSLGFDSYKSLTNFNLDEKIGMGLSDMSMFRQSMDFLQDMKTPFYAFYVTLSNHLPFDIQKKYRELKLDPMLENSYLGGYLQSVKYTDRAIGGFIESLEKKGILNNSIIVIYGDHNGIFRKDRAVIEKFLAHKSISDEQWYREYAQVPLLIYNPNIKGNVNKVIGGQIDLLPTIEYLMGTNTDISEYTMGRNLFFVNDGSSIIPKGGYSQNPFYITKDKIYTNLSSEQRDALNVSELIIKGNYFKKKDE